MRILLGIVLIGVALVALFGIIVIPVLPPTQDNATIDNFLASLLCNPGEKMVREQYQTRDSDGTSYSMTPYCVNSERQREDVTGKWVLYGAGGFVVPFLIGLLMIITGASAAVRQRTAQPLDAFPTGFGSTSGYTVINASGGGVKNVEFQDGALKVNGIQIKLDNLSPDKVQALKAQMQSMSGGDLTSKLRQLEDAKNNGLISSDEYDRLRRRILDDMG